MLAQSVKSCTDQGLKVHPCVVNGKTSGHVKVAAMLQQPGILSDF